MIGRYLGESREKNHEYAPMEIIFKRYKLWHCEKPNGNVC